MSDLESNQEFAPLDQNHREEEFFPSDEPSADSETTEGIHNPFQLLFESSHAYSSGLLKVYGEKASWTIYLYRGKLQYASLSFQSLEELRFHLRTIGCKEAIEAIKAAQAISTYEEHRLEEMPLDRVINWLSEKRFLNSQQISQLVQLITKEALEPLFWLRDATYCWEERNSQEIAVTLETPFEVTQLKETFEKRLQTWQGFLDEIESPFQRPYFFNHRAIQSASNTMLGKLSKYMRGYSIHQLAKMIKQDEIKFARMLYPYLQNGEICLREPKAPWDSLPPIPKLLPNQPQDSASSPAAVKEKTYQIACVDDSPTMLREIQRFLQDEDYEITQIDNPIEAAATLFRVQPDLILMDISMPEINGYKLCSLLRNSNALSQVPIIMVTSRTGVIDKVRAKTVGATDYLTKPFSQETLLSLIEKYLG